MIPCEDFLKKQIKQIPNSSDAILHKIKRILIDELLLPFKEKDLDIKKSLIEDCGLDSIQIMELIIALEMEFGMSVSEDGITREVFETLGSLTDFVEKKIK